MCAVTVTSPSIRACQARRGYSGDSKCSRLGWMVLGKAAKSSNRVRYLKNTYGLRVLLRKTFDQVLAVLWLAKTLSDFEINSLEACLPQVTCDNTPLCYTLSDFVCPRLFPFSARVGACGSYDVPPIINPRHTMR